MVEALIFALAALAAFADWPWWTALIFGALAGLWTTRVRARLWAKPGDIARMPSAGMSLTIGAMVFGALLCLMVYFAVQSIAGHM